jgi:uncharacterized protein DUF6893
MVLFRRKKGRPVFMRIIGGAIALAFVAAVISAIPDIARYIKIREM